jgi:lycopene beta-cyclase
MISITNITKKITEYPLSNGEKLSYLLIIAWLLTMIAFPIAYWTLGSSIIPTGITLAAIVQGSATFSILANVMGWRKSLGIFGIVAVVTWFAEFIGSTTGFPFGVYHYTDVLQPQLFGVPLLIPIAWFMLMPSAWALAQVITRADQSTLLGRVQFAFISALAFTAWDLFLDPQMVSWNFWQWQDPSGYFGIPFINFFGWVLTSFIVSFIINPIKLPVLPLAIIYACVWFLQSVGLAVFWGQPGPALFGSLAMGGFMLWAYYRSKGNTHD